jgi:hypothetical protein
MSRPERSLSLLAMALYTGACGLEVQETGGASIEDAPPLHVDALEAKTQNDCLGEARECTYSALRTATTTLPAEPRSVFRSCMDKLTAFDDAEDATVWCHPTCQGDVGHELCDHAADVSAWTATAPDLCISAFEGCMDDCASEGDNQNDGIFPDDDPMGWPEAACMWAGSERTDCESFTRSRAGCGGTLPDPATDHHACMLYCDATAGIWIDTGDEDICTDESSDACQYCTSQCEGVGVPQPPPPPLPDATFTTVLSEHHLLTQDDTERLTIIVPEGITALRVTVTPISPDSDPDLTVRAPGQTDHSVCESQASIGDTESCDVRPKASHPTITAGTWSVEIYAAMNDEGPDRYEYDVKVELGRAPATTAQ